MPKERKPPSSLVGGVLAAIGILLGGLGLLFALGLPGPDAPATLPQGPVVVGPGGLASDLPPPSIPPAPTSPEAEPIVLAGFRDGVELNQKSEYSHIKITRNGNVRTLWFVRDNGEEVIESMLDLAKPHEMLVSYVRFMFLSYVFRPKQEKVLIVGLGGGSMVHFLRHYDPNVKVDVVEIDPAIVKIAEKYFGVKSGGNVNIITKDAFDYFKNTEARYDVIYMDAFLKPSGATDETGVPLRLKTIAFYKDLQKKLTPSGMVVFNINPHEKIKEDVKNIKDAFPQAYVFDLPGGGLVVVGSLVAERMKNEAMINAGNDADWRFKTSFSFRNMLSRLVAN
jgi:spermidine synthase